MCSISVVAKGHLLSHFRTHNKHNSNNVLIKIQKHIVMVFTNMKQLIVDNMSAVPNKIAS